MNDSRDQSWQSGTLAGGPQPFDAGELEETDVVVLGAIGLIELRGESAAADPVAGGVLLENDGVERVHAAQLEDDTAVQQRVWLHRGLGWLFMFIFASYFFT